MHCKESKTIRDLLVVQRTKTPSTGKMGSAMDTSVAGCIEEYIGEYGRTLAVRFKEYLKAHSSIYCHHNITGHPTTIKNFSILAIEEQNLARSIKEAILIMVNDPSQNNNIGK